MNGKSKERKIVPRLTKEKEGEEKGYISRNDAYLAELINQSWPHAACAEKGRGGKNWNCGRSTSGDGGLLFSRSSTKQRTKSHRRGLINERRACGERRTIMRLGDTNCPRVVASSLSMEESACTRAYTPISNEKII